MTVLEKLIETAKARFEIAMAMVKKPAKVDVRDKTIRRVFGFKEYRVPPIANETQLGEG